MMLNPWYASGVTQVIQTRSGPYLKQERTDKYRTTDSMLEISATIISGRTIQGSVDQCDQCSSLYRSLETSNKEKRALANCPDLYLLMEK